MDLKEYANGLRTLAALIEAHPEIGVPLETTFNIFPRVPEEDIRAHAAHTAKALGFVKKEEFGSDIQLVAEVGAFSLKVWYSREQICERVELGRKLVPARPRIEETIIKEAIAEHEEIVYGWKCQPILGKPEAADAQSPIL